MEPGPAVGTNAVRFVNNHTAGHVNPILNDLPKFVPAAMTLDKFRGQCAFLSLCRCVSVLHPRKVKSDFAR